MPKKALRPTGRRPYKQRFFAKAKASKARSVAVYANRQQYTAIPRNYFARLPSTFNVRLSATYVTAIINLAASVGGSSTRGRFDLSTPYINNGTTTLNVAGGLLPLMYIYQRCYVKKAHVSWKLENLNFPTTPNGLHNNEYRVVSALMTSKQATEYIGATSITVDELRMIPGSKFSVSSPFPQNTITVTHTHSVDTASFTGQSSLDHTQACYSTESGSNLNLNVPSGASIQNLPSFFYMFQRAAYDQTSSYRFNLAIDFDCEFTNIRALEQSAAEMLPWAIL